MNKLIRAFQTLNRCDWYVFFWCIYQMQDILYPQGVINQGIQALIMGWAIYEAGIYMLPQRNLPIMLKAVTILLFMYIIYGGIFIIFGSDFYSTPSAYLKSFVNSFLPFFLFYKYSQDGYLDEKRFRIYFLFFLCIIIAQFFHAEKLAIQKLRQRGSSRTEITNNIGYFFVSLFPMLYFWYKNRILQYSSMCLVLLFVLLGMKRGAILIASVCTIMFLIDSIKNSTNKKHKYQTIVFGLTMLLLTTGVISYQMANSEYFQRRVESSQEGNVSGRDRIYQNIMDAIVNDDSYTHLFVGRGSFSTMTLSGNGLAAHHDWLETACNNGLIGVLILAFYFFCFYKTAKNAQGVVKPELKNCMMMFFFASFLKTWFSMSLQDMPIYVTMPMAYFTYHTYNSKKIQRIAKV